MPHSKREDAQRVTLEEPVPAQMMAIDGTWRRPCTIKDVSDASATLLMENSIGGLALKELFLLLSSTGLAYRRCQLDGVNGAEIAVSFLRHKNKPTTSKSSDDLV